jgi:hypothetical protein
MSELKTHPPSLTLWRVVGVCGVWQIPGVDPEFSGATPEIVRNDEFFG